MRTAARDRPPLSRRRAIQSLLGLGGLGALGLVFRATRRSVEGSRSPWLRIHEGATAPGDPSETPALWLALAALTPSRRSSLLDEVEAAMASVEARANPLLVDLVEDDVVDVFRRNQGWLLPICTAASALLAHSYLGPDGFGVEALAVDAPREPRDLRAWKTPTEDARERRARFLAWPVSRSLIARSRNNAGARLVEAALRDASTRPESAVALVLDRRLLHGTSPEPRLDAVLARLSKARRRIQTDADLGLVPDAPTPGPCIVPWAALEDGELLVVPKLSALSPSGRFESEIRQILRGADADLVTAEGA